MRKYCIVSFLDSFDFPLREATRKQVWWEAKNAKKQGKDVNIYIIDHDAESVVKDGITIKFVSAKNLCKSNLRADEVNYLTGSVIPNLLSIVFVKSKKKILTLTDGYMFGANKYWMRKTISKILPIFFDEICIYSRYQKQLLGYGKIVSPHKPQLLIPDIPKSDYPSILYMGHISKSKGFDAIIIALSRLLGENSSYEFVIANNMIEVSKEYMDKVQMLIDKYPNQIIIKGIVNPLEELKRSWVYIYPFIEARGTMAFPLSLYEAEQCGTPFIACDISSNSEFFDKKNLIEPNNADQLYDRIKNFIHERENSEHL